MNASEEIKQLTQRIEALKATQVNCKHVFGETRYNPYLAKEEYLTGEYDYQGIHMWPKTAYRDVSKPRWTKVCTLCGIEKHTETQKNVSSPKLEPDFD